MNEKGVVLCSKKCGKATWLASHIANNWESKTFGWYDLIKKLAHMRWIRRWCTDVLCHSTWHWLDWIHISAWTFSRDAGDVVSRIISRKEDGCFLFFFGYRFEWMDFLFLFVFKMNIDLFCLLCNDVVTNRWSSFLFFICSCVIDFCLFLDARQEAERIFGPCKSAFWLFQTHRIQGTKLEISIKTHSWVTWPDRPMCKMTANKVGHVFHKRWPTFLYF